MRNLILSANQKRLSKISFLKTKKNDFLTTGPAAINVTPDPGVTVHRIFNLDRTPRKVPFKD